MRQMASEPQFRITNGGKKFRNEDGFAFASLGQTVRLDDLRVGIIRYIGPFHLARGEYVGLELLNCTGKSNGTIKKRKYFEAPENSAIFVPQKKVFEVVPGESAQEIIQTKDHFEYMREIYESCLTNDLIQEYPRRVRAQIMDGVAANLGLGAVHLIHSIFHFLGSYDSNYCITLELDFGVVTRPKIRYGYQYGSGTVSLRLKNDKYGQRKGSATIVEKMEYAQFTDFKMNTGTEINESEPFKWKISDGKYKLMGFEKPRYSWGRDSRFEKICDLAKRCPYLTIDKGPGGDKMEACLSFLVHSDKARDFSRPTITESR